ncbi:MAG: hypothetical protein ACPLTR_02000 [Thermacetogeniaceae bacterium]
MLTPTNIWQCKQNKPTLIAKDLIAYGVPEDVTYRVLLERGVFKWLAVRRDLIKAKDRWKQAITETIQKIREAKKDGRQGDLMYLRGYLKALEMCRNEVRSMCKSERWRAPDFDKGAREFLERLGKEA